MKKVNVSESTSQQSILVVNPYWNTPKDSKAIKKHMENQSANISANIR